MNTKLRIYMNKFIFLFSLFFIFIENVFAFCGQYDKVTILDDKFKMIKCGNYYYKQSFCNTYFWNSYDKIFVDTSGYQPVLVNTDKGEKCEYQQVY